MRFYLDDAGKYDLLTKDDEIRLAKVIEAGAEAKQRLATAVNLSAAAKRKLMMQKKTSLPGIEPGA